MLKRANLQWSGKRLSNGVKNGEITFDCAIQRGLVWDNDKKSLLINSMVMNYPIPALYFSRHDGNIFDALDGKQRSNAIHDFINNQFALTENTPCIVDETGEELEIAGMTFEQLPEWAQDAIKDYSLTIYYYDGITPEEVTELFYRINNGKPLTAIELTRVKAKSLEAFQSIAKHGMIDIAVNEKGKIKYNHENLVMQMWTVCFAPAENLDFSTKPFRAFIEKADVTEQQETRLLQCLDFVKYFHDQQDIQDKEQKRVLRKIKTRSHTVSLCYLANKFIENGMSNEQFAAVAYDFYNVTAISKDVNYNASLAKGSTARPENVRKRISALDTLVEQAKTKAKSNELSA